MEQIKIMIPAYLSKELDSFLQKSKKNITELEWSLSEPYKKMFVHTLVDDCGIHRIKEMHEVQDLSLTMPTVSDWVLVAVYEDDAVFVANPTKKLVKNDIDNNIYKRAGSVTYNPDTMEVECYAYIKNVWNGNYTLDRCCKGKKKGIAIANEK